MSPLRTIEREDEPCESLARVYTQVLHFHLHPSHDKPSPFSRRAFPSSSHFLPTNLLLAYFSLLLAIHLQSSAIYFQSTDLLSAFLIFSELQKSSSTSPFLLHVFHALSRALSDTRVRRADTRVLLSLYVLHHGG